jgi:hypothetical protein
MMPGRAQASTGSPAAADSAEQQILPEQEDLGASVRSASRLVTRTKSAIWPLRRWIKRLAGCLRMELLTTNDHADLRMGMH